MHGGGGGGSREAAPYPDPSGARNKTWMRGSSPRKTTSDCLVRSSNMRESQRQFPRTALRSMGQRRGIRYTGAAARKRKFYTPSVRKITLAPSQALISRPAIEWFHNTEEFCRDPPQADICPLGGGSRGQTSIRVRRTRPRIRPAGHRHRAVGRASPATILPSPAARLFRKRKSRRLSETVNNRPVYHDRPVDATAAGGRAGASVRGRARCPVHFLFAPLLLFDEGLS